MRIISKGREIYYLKIITLAIAFGCSALILSFSLSEFGYDRFHKDYESIFRILQRNNAESYDGNRLSNKIPQKITTTLSSLESPSLILSRIKLMKDINVKVKGKTFHNSIIYAADPNITKIFSFDVLRGPLQDFQKERKVIISSTTAKKYFGTSDALGKELKLYTVGDTLAFSVAAVFKDYPHNTHESFDCFITFSEADISSLHFEPNVAAVYGKMSKGNSVKVGKVLSSISDTNGMNYLIQPISEIYFGPRVLGEDARHGDHYSIIVLICIASLILFLAVTSYINLTTLSLPNRSKEIAIKKLAGTADHKILIGFAKESVATVLVSSVLGLLILIAASDWLTPILSTGVWSLLWNGGLTLILVLLLLLAIVAVSPMFLVVKFSNAKPTRLLSADTITFPGFKRTITFLQLGISLFLIVASMVLRRQVTYSLLKEPGRNYEQIVYMKYPNGLDNEGLRNLRAYWQKNTANILDILGVTQLPNQIQSRQIHSDYYFLGVDPEFGQFFGVQMTKGNWFMPNTGDSVFVVNEAAAKILGPNADNVIGVFKDFAEQFNQPEKPVKLNLVSHFNYNFLCIRILEVDIRKTIKFLSTFFNKANQKSSVTFLNRRFEEWIVYQDRLNSLSEILAVISGVLSCCAIYALSISIVRDKLKQIAVHKLLGATNFRITRLLVREFTAEMIKAVLIFGPATYLIINEFLRNFVYATDFIWTDPIIPMAYCAATIILLCVFQTLSLNRKNLSDALKM